MFGSVICKTLGMLKLQIQEGHAESINMLKSSTCNTRSKDEGNGLHTETSTPHPTIASVILSKNFIYDKTNKWDSHRILKIYI
jgi:hypothetical protein